MTTHNQEIAFSPLMNREEAANWLGITEKALGQLNYLGTGPKYVVVGSRSVRYRLKDLIEYAEANTRTQSGA